MIKRITCDELFDSQEPRNDYRPLGWMSQLPGMMTLDVDATIGRQDVAPYLPGAAPQGPLSDSYRTSRGQ